MKRWLVNGEPGGQVSPFDRGLAYGDGLFETIAVRDGACRFLPAHLARLSASCARIGLPQPAADELAQEAATLIAADSCGTLKITLTRGTGARGYAPPPAPAVTRIVAFEPEALPVVPAAGIVARVCSTRVSENPRLAGMKTLNRLEQVLARAEWTDPRITEGLLLNARDEIICGVTSNVFVVTGDELLTPQLDRAGVHGVMRAKVMEIAAAAGAPARETRIPVAQLQDAAALFFTNSRLGLVPVAALDARHYAPNAMVTRLRAGLYAAGVAEAAP